MNFECQKYEELAGPDEVYKKVIDGGPPAFDQLPSDWLIQLKYDGIWAQVVIEHGKYYVYSKTGQQKKVAFLTQQGLALAPELQTILIGEYMFGSQWSTHPERAGKLYVFDCLVCEGRDISSLPYKDRYRAAVSATLQLGQPFNILPCYSISKLGEFWTTLQDQTEGFIIRRWSSLWNVTLFKLKFEVEDDFVVTGFVEGKGKHEGRLGAIQLSQYENGELKYVQDVGGGFTDQERIDFWREREAGIGKVLLVRGKGRFNTGALRHPNFIRIRHDKLPAECLLKRQSK
jgi:ATP-dependent DNA ligase